MHLVNGFLLVMEAATDGLRPDGDFDVLFRPFDYSERIQVAMENVSDSGVDLVVEELSGMRMELETIRQALRMENPPDPRFSDHIARAQIEVTEAIRKCRQ